MNPETPRRTSSFTTRAQEDFRSGGRKRLAGAVGVVILGLIALVVLGPDESEVKERFEYYGAPGEMRIMEEISIDDGRDMAAQVPKSLSIPPPPARLEIEEDEPSPDGIEAIPDERDADPNRIDVAKENPQENAEVSENFQVEMQLPQQRSESYYLIHAPRPEYPLEATEIERRTPVIVVKVGIFVGPDGHVSDVMILASNGSRVFEQAVLDALKDWRFGWLTDPGAGRWLQFPINFKSPYFTPGR